MEGIEKFKKEAAERALDLVRSGMRLGMGTGTTARYFTEGLGQRLADGRLADIVAVPTSESTEAKARGLGIPIVSLQADGLDLAVDGMDEVTPTLDAIKGLGGALTREKIVASAAQRFVLIGDERKRVARLGERAPVPVEVLRFGWQRTARRLEELGARPALRGGEGEPYVTDNDNLILDCWFDAPFDATRVARAIEATPGAVEHGLFLGIAVRAFVAGADGVTELRREPA